MSRATLFLIYGALALVVLLVDTWVEHSIQVYQQRGVATNAQLVRYYQTGAGRAGTDTVWGVVQYRVADQVVSAPVPIGNHETASDKDFVAATSTGIVPIVYDPLHPTSIAFNGNDEVAHRHPRRLFLWIALLGVGCLSVVFVPVIIAAGPS